MEGQDGLAPENDWVRLSISHPLAGEPRRLQSARLTEGPAEIERSGRRAARRTVPSVSLRETSPAVEAPRYESIFGEGLIEVSGKGFGFLRDPKRNYIQSPQDIFVTPEVVRKHALRDGLWIKGEVRRGSRGPQLFKLALINSEDPDKVSEPACLRGTYFDQSFRKNSSGDRSGRYTTRVMDLMTPIGKGQRGLIVAPPRTGKTTLLQHIADAVVRNHPEMKLIILLVDERPEEVTEIRRTVPKGDIMASSNDSDIKSHTRIAQLAIERAKRLVEAGKDVFVLMDSLTRLAALSITQSLVAAGR